MALPVEGTIISVMLMASNSPYCKVVITTSEGVSTETFESNSGSNPLIFMREDSQVWTGELEILLWNGDQGLAAKDYTGRRVNPYWGYTTGSGDESVVHAPYWVVDQEFIAFSGTSYLKLTCWSVWDMMGIKAVGGDAGGTASPSFAVDTTTLAAMVDELLDGIKLKGFTSAGIPLTVPGGDLDTTTDFTTGIFKEYRPEIVAEWGDSVRSVIRQVMDLTLCGLRMRDDGMRVLYPASGDSNDYVFGGVLPVLSSNMHASIVVPNKIIYVDLLPDIVGANATHEGIANDSSSQNRVGVMTQIFSPRAGTTIGNNESGTADILGGDEAQQRADTILSSLQHEASEGMITLRPHPGIEVWDKANVVDPISGVTTNGRVGRVESIWDATGLATPRTRYVQTVEFGGLTMRASNLSRYLGLGVNIGEVFREEAGPPVVAAPLITNSVSNISGFDQELGAANVTTVINRAAVVRRASEIESAIRASGAKAPPEDPPGFLDRLIKIMSFYRLR